MDQHGFLPEHPCRTCGRILRGMGTGYPAELYAGTYTGLCYPCTNAVPYMVSESVDEIVWSWPPSEPAHRRDRERYVQVKGCACDRGRYRRSACAKCSALRFWRDHLRDFRRSCERRVHQISEQLEREARTIAKRMQWNDADASDALMHSALSAKNRTMLFSVWTEPRAEYWEIPDA